MSPKYWEYFLSIEADLVTCSRYTELDPKNYKTYSNEFARILIAAGSELDTVLRDFCSAISPSSPAKNISQYFPIITGRYPQLLSATVDARAKNLSFSPWVQWSAVKSPSWWCDGFNAIKHDRTNSFEAANLENALNSVAGLFLLIIYYHDATSGKAVEVDLNRGTSLFTPGKALTDKGGVYWYYGI